MSATLSPRQVESVEQWLDEQPRSQNENDSILIPGRRPFTQESKTPLPMPSAYQTSNQRPHNPTNSSRLVPNDRGLHDRDLHVHSRLQMHSRLSRAHADDPDAYVDPVECFLRVCSACLASAALAVGAVTYVLVHNNNSNRLPAGGSVLDNRLGWVVAVPVSAAAIAWQLTRLSLLAWHTTSPDNSAVLLAVDILLEALLAVGSVICSILAGFQAARHTAYNRRQQHGSGSGGPLYEDVGPEIALSALLGLLSLTSFAVLALAFVEAHRRRRRNGASNRSTSSSVIEIIS
ncbi:hypothetical protein SCUCBS95973_009756 [Sporothrix curviconia]|uniref:MARVEL domain-containing protein n=1 Tax=Sporothrix curviconia TaxID=1260050 RepID=A0ABP0CXI4_9PEZI